jgi:hypothetical protein
MKKGDLIQFVSSDPRYRARGILLEDVPEDSNFRTTLTVYMYYVPSWKNLEQGEIWNIKLSKLKRLYRVFE